MKAEGTEVPEYRRKMEKVVRELRASKLDLASSASAWIRQELRSYQPVKEEDLLISIQLNLERSVKTLLSNTVPTTEDGENRETTRQRMDVEVPIGDIIRGYRISLTVIYEEFLSLADSAGMTAAQTLEGSHLLWQLGDWFTTGAAAEFRYRAAQGEVQRALERAEAVRQVTSSDKWVDGFEERLRELGLDLNVWYRVVIGTQDDQSSNPTHRADPSYSRVGLSAEINGQSVVIWPVHFDVEKALLNTNRCWAVGPPRPLSRLYESAEISKRILRSLPQGSRGAYAAGDVGWRLVLPLEPLTLEVLSETYLEPLEASPNSGAEILQTLEHYLDQGRNVRRTAETMTVHQNTVRYRLESFERLTGTSLNETDVLVELTMLLARHSYSSRGRS